MTPENKPVRMQKKYPQLHEIMLRTLEEL